MGIRGVLRLDKGTVKFDEEFTDAAGLWVNELHWPMITYSTGCFGGEKITLRDVLQDWGNSLHVAHHSSGHF
jgi:hypothetical protein